MKECMHVAGCSSGGWQEAKSSIFKELIPLLTFIKEVSHPPYPPSLPPST